MSASRTELARGLFAPLGPTYDRYAKLLSFGQDPRWRHFLVSRLPVGQDDTVLDVACGTAAVTLELVRQKACAVVGVDQSPEMLDEARRRLLLAAETRRVRLVEASAAELPFEDGTFDGLTAAYLLRYLDDLPAGLAELGRVMRPGATASLLDFGVPPGPLPRSAWNLWVDVGLPVLGRAISPGWHEVGRFLGGSIRDFDERWPVARLVGAFREAGFEHVQARRLSLGGCTVLWGRRA
ncbi:MAG TPA: class I SAM-dependent methyltransferase [Gaiellaceae bacterium]|nr:class I SAM-dependent methyltransferase [Gaiellaceae bacterium]